MQERFYESGSCVQKNCAILGVHPKNLEPTWVQTQANWPHFRVLAAEGQLNQRGLWSGRWESKSSPLGFSRTYVAGLVLFWKDLVASGTLTAASMSPCFPRLFLTCLRLASRTVLGTACV